MKYLPILALLITGCASTPNPKPLPSISHCFPDPQEVETTINAILAEQGAPELSPQTQVLIKDLIAHSGRRAVACLADAIARKNADLADTIRRFMNADQP